MMVYNLPASDLTFAKKLENNHTTKQEANQ